MGCRETPPEKPVMTTDERAVELISQGSPEGMELLYDRYGSLAYAVALRILRDEGAAEDVVQEAFLSIWRGAASYRPDRGGVRSWLCTVVRNRSIDRTRGRAGRSRQELPIDHVAADASPSDTWNEVVAELDREHIRRALDALTAEQRTTIELAYFGGLSQSEISERMQVPLGTVKGRTRLALRTLRGALGGWCLAPAG
jgi:RNA polymerase sigma-70 factor (ECF subfamily)